MNNIAATTMNEVNINHMGHPSIGYFCPVCLDEDEDNLEYDIETVNIDISELNIINV